MSAGGYRPDPKRPSPVTPSSSGDDSSMSAQPRTQEPGTADLPTLFDERYVLEQRLGGGGMGVVFRARDLIAEKRHDRHPYVAIKLISESLRNSDQARTLLQRECSRAQRLSHPNIVRVYHYDCEERTDCDYLIMELLRGESLERVIRAYPAGMEWNRAASVIRQLCDGLQYAHAEGIVHSDIKPSNLFMTDAGVLKILDFGIAAPLRGADTATSDTMLNPRRLGAVAPRYSSLEMFLGKDADPSDDVYSAACVIYEVLTGQHPYQGMETPRAAELTLVPAPIPVLNRAQNRALRKALSFRRIDRTATIVELRLGLLEQTSMLPGPRMRYIVGGSAAAVLAVAAVVFWRIPPVELRTPPSASGPQAPPPTSTSGPAATNTSGPAPTSTSSPAPANTSSPAPTSTSSPAPTSTSSPVPATVSPRIQPVETTTPSSGSANIAPRKRPVEAPAPEPAIVAPHNQPVVATTAPPAPVTETERTRPAVNTSTPILTPPAQTATQAPQIAPALTDSPTPAQDKQQAARRRASGPTGRSTPPTAAPSTKASDSPSIRSKAEDRRCASLSEQVQLGEILNEEERTYLKQHCK